MSKEDDVLEKFLEQQKNKKPAARDPEFEEKEKKLYVRQLAERDALQKQQREETARAGESKELEKRHDQQIAKLTEFFEKEREIFYRANSPQKTPAVQDPNFIAKVLFTEDPEYKQLMHNLQLRQEQEARKLVEQQIQRRIEYGQKNPNATRETLDANWKRDLEDRKKLLNKHGGEIDRYTREYHDAKVLLQEMREKEKKQTLEDAPKRTR